MTLAHTTDILERQKSHKHTIKNAVHCSIATVHTNIQKNQQRLSAPLPHGIKYICHKIIHFPFPCQLHMLLPLNTLQVPSNTN
jgi:hypothetical protein